MRSAPPPPDGSPLTRSVAACLASILELDVADVPVPHAAHPAPWTVWREWLGGRGLGLVPVREPRTFGWPGPWLALLPAADGGQVAAVAFGVPPGLAWSPLGGPERFEAVEAGWVVAPAAPASWTPAWAPAGTAAGRVEALALAPSAAAPMVLVPQARAQAGLGLEGDRYADGAGTFSDPQASGTALTLVEGEALDELMTAVPGFGGGALAPEVVARRNVITRGVALDALVGERFLVGGVECLGRRRCEPCAHLQRLTAPGVLRGLVHRGGLRADILSDGVIRVGDAVRAA